MDKRSSIWTMLDLAWSRACPAMKSAGYKAVLHSSARLAGVLLIVLAACSTAPTPSPTSTPATTATPPPADELAIYNWDTYMDPDILANLEHRLGVKITYHTFSNLEEMLETVRAQPDAYDLIVSSDYMISQLQQEGLLATLDKANIPNMANLDPDFANTIFDPGNRYCAPYQWGTMGIGYNIKAVGKEISGWQDFFDPAYAGRVAMLDDMRNTIGVTLLYLGYSPNTTQPAEIKATRDFLISRADHIAAYAPDTGQDLLAAGEVVMAYEWNGDILQLMEDHPDIRYVIPEEGSIIWTDVLCIPSQARHKRAAEQFINLIFEPEVGAALSNFTHYATPNRAALELVNQADRINPNLYPPTRVRNRLFMLAGLPTDAARAYGQAWDDILAHEAP